MAKAMLAGFLQITGFALMYHGGMNWWEIGGIFIVLWGYGIQGGIK